MNLVEGFPKARRVLNVDLIQSIRELRCLVCLRTPCDAHHVTTRKAGGGDTEENLMPLCRQHHVEWHASGIGHMVRSYPLVKLWLEKKGRSDILERADRSNGSKIGRQQSLE